MTQSYSYDHERKNPVLLQKSVLLKKMKAECLKLIIRNQLNTVIAVTVFGVCIPIKLLICMGKSDSSLESVTFSTVLASEI